MSRIQWNWRVVLPVKSTPMRCCSQSWYSKMFSQSMSQPRLLLSSHASYFSRFAISTCCLVYIYANRMLTMVCRLCLSMGTCIHTWATALAKSYYNTVKRFSYYTAIFGSKWDRQEQKPLNTNKQWRERQMWDKQSEIYIRCYTCTCTGRGVGGACTWISWCYSLRTNVK